MRKFIYIMVSFCIVGILQSQTFPSSDPDSIFTYYDATGKPKGHDTKMFLNRNKRSNLKNVYLINDSILKNNYNNNDFLKKDFTKLISGGQDDGVYNSYASIDPTKGEMEANIALPFNNCISKEFMGFIRINAKGSIADNTLDFFKDGELVGGGTLRVGLDFMLPGLHIIDADSNRVSRLHLIKNNTRLNLQYDSISFIIEGIIDKVNKLNNDATEMCFQQVQLFNRIIIKYEIDNEKLIEGINEIQQLSFIPDSVKTRLPSLGVMLKSEIKKIVEKKKIEDATDIILARSKYIIKYYNWIGFDGAFTPQFYTVFDPISSIGKVETKVFPGANFILRYNFLTIGDRKWYQNHYFSLYVKFAYGNNLSNLKQYDSKMPYVGQTIPGDTSSVDTITSITRGNKAYSSTEFREFGTVTTGFDYIMYLMKDRSFGLNAFSSLDYIFTTQSLRTTGSLFEQRFRWNLGGGIVFSIPKKGQKTALNLGVYLLVNDVTGPKTPETPNTQTLTIGLKAAMPFLMLK